MKPASRVSDGCRIDFWLRSNGIVIASNEDDANVVSIASTVVSTTINFEWPAQKYLVEQIEQIATKAVAKGKYLAKEELRNWLGVKER